MCTSGIAGVAECALQLLQPRLCAATIGVQGAAPFVRACLSSPPLTQAAAGLTCQARLLLQEGCSCRRRCLQPPAQLLHHCSISTAGGTGGALLLAVRHWRVHMTRHPGGGERRGHRYRHSINNRPTPEAARVGLHCRFKHSTCYRPPTTSAVSEADPRNRWCTRGGRSGCHWTPVPTSYIPSLFPLPRRPCKPTAAPPRPPPCSRGSAAASKHSTCRTAATTPAAVSWVAPSSR